MTNKQKRKLTALVRDWTNEKGFVPGGGRSDLRPGIMLADIKGWPTTRQDALVLALDADDEAGIKAALLGESLEARDADIRRKVCPFYGRLQMTPSELTQALHGFTGTETYWKHRAGLLYTDGVMFLAENAGCYWLLDAIASHQPECRKDEMLKEYQFWTLTVKDSKAVLVCERDAGNVAFRQAIEFTDFPLPEIKLWVEGNVVLLPSEH